MGYFGVAATPLPHTTSLIYGACRAAQARQTRSLGLRVSAPAISSRVQSSAPHTVGQELNTRFF